MQNPPLKRGTWRWAFLSLFLGAATLISSFLAPPLWTSVLGLPATALALAFYLQSRRYPRVYLGKSVMVLALVLGGVSTYTALGKIGYAYLWRHTFQLSNQLETFQEPVEGWSIRYPRDWERLEQRVSGTTTHLFKPSKVTPTMFFSITSRPNVGTRSIDLVVNGFFENLPNRDGIKIIEQNAVRLDSGKEAYQVVYVEESQRIPLKNQVVFVLDESHLYFITVGGAPRWFDRHRDYLENLLFSLKIA